jgi:hypothetical protein
MSELETGMTMYEVAKRELSLKTPLEDKKAKEILENWIKEQYQTSDSMYQMLLCRERNDYTIFKFNHINSIFYAQELFEVLQSRGAIIQLTPANEGVDVGAFECWVRSAGDVFMYYLFPCDDFVINV